MILYLFSNRNNLNPDGKHRTAHNCPARFRVKTEVKCKTFAKHWNALTYMYIGERGKKMGAIFNVHSFAFVNKNALVLGIMYYFQTLSEWTVIFYLIAFFSSPILLFLPIICRLCSVMKGEY